MLNYPQTPIKTLFRISAENFNELENYSTHLDEGNWEIEKTSFDTPFFIFSDMPIHKIIRKIGDKTQMNNFNSK